MKEVTLAALDRITKEMERLSESVQKVNERQAHFESVLKLGPRPTDQTYTAFCLTRMAI